MKKAGDLRPGDKVIYKSGFDVIEATVVDKPIDEHPRPKFAIGRIDLDNGGYLTCGSYIYDSVEECKNRIITEIKEEISKYKDQKKVAEGMIIVLEKTLKKYL